MEPRAPSPGAWRVLAGGCYPISDNNIVAQKEVTFGVFYRF